MEQQHASRHPRIATAAGIVGQSAFGLAALGLLIAFVLALQSREAADTGDVPTTAALDRRSPPAVVGQGRAVAQRDSPIIYIYGPPELAAAVRADIATLVLASGMDGDSIPEVIIDGLSGGQRKVSFVDLR